MKKDDKIPEEKQETNPNLSIWDAVSKTNPIHTKAFTKAGGFKGVGIKPISLIHRATELWGPMGERWGSEEAEREILGDIVFMKARVWYPAILGRASVEHWGGDVLVRHDGKPNDEAFKMAFTDAIGKCLSQLGFSADIYMGLFDDSKYLKEISEEFGVEPKGGANGPSNGAKEPESAFINQETRVIWTNGVKGEFMKAKAIPECDNIREKYRAKIEEMKASKHHLDAVSLDHLKQAYADRVKELSKGVDVKDDKIPY